MDNARLLNEIDPAAPSRASGQLRQYGRRRGDVRWQDVARRLESQFPAHPKAVRAGSVIDKMRETADRGCFGAGRGGVEADLGGGGREHCKILMAFSENRAREKR